MIRKRARFLFAFSMVAGILLIAASLNSGAMLPPYDPYSFFEDFSGPVLNPNLWTFTNVQTGLVDRESNYSIQNSEITLNSAVGGFSFLNHSFVTNWWGQSAEAWTGYIEFRVRFDDFAAGAHNLTIARIDGGSVGVNNSQFVYYNENATDGFVDVYTLQSGIDKNWHVFTINFSNDGRKVYWDGQLRFSSPVVKRFRLILLGNSVADTVSGGSLSFDWVKTKVVH
jgi:hypothetical protein